MKHTLLYAMTMVGMLALSSCSCSCGSFTGSDDCKDMVTVPVQLSGSFTSLAVSNNIDVEYSDASSASATLTVCEKYCDNVRFDISGGQLHIYSKGNVRGSVKVVLAAPGVDSFTATNNADITIVKSISRDTFTVKAMNNSDVDVAGLICRELTVTATNNADVDVKKLQATAVSVSALNNADVTLRGQAKTVGYSATNNAEISAVGLKAESGQATAVNLATITCNVEHLNSSATNMATVKNK